MSKTYINLQLEEDITKKLGISLQRFNYDDESMKDAWSVLDNLSSNISNDIIGKSLCQICSSRNTQLNIICGISELLTSFEKKEIEPWGTKILEDMFHYDNEIVIEYALTLLDNWKDKSFIPVLQTLQPTSSWLKSYTEEVLQSMND